MTAATTRTTARPAPSADTTVGVLVPTRDEAANVQPLLTRLARALSPLDAQVLFVDDSTDDTPGAVRAAAAHTPLPVRLLHRDAPERTGGLGGAVQAGLRALGTHWVVVMDGDLQHPPELIPALLAHAQRERLDLVAASRYAGEGDAAGLAGPVRRAVSRAATAAAKLTFRRCLSGISDPMTGFFLVRRDALDVDALRPVGFKILLEICGRHPGLRVGEIPFTFESRHDGTSKADGREGLRFLAHLVRLRAEVLR